MSKKYCGGCVRFATNMDKKNHPHSFNCACRHREDSEVYADAPACEIYLDFEEREASDRQRKKEQREKVVRLHEETKNLPPMKLKFEDSYDGMRDIIIPMGDPVCPYCGEMPYSLEECVFCGMKFIQEDEALTEYKELNTGTKEEIGQCAKCGKETMHITYYKSNGEWRAGHGRCTECGTRFIV